MNKWVSNNIIISLHSETNKLAFNLDCTVWEQKKSVNANVGWHNITRRAISTAEIEDKASLINNLPPIGPAGCDTPVSDFDPIKGFSLKFLGELSSPYYKLIWHASCPLKVKIFFKLVTKTKLNSWSNLSKRDAQVVLNAPFASLPLRALPTYLSSVPLSLFFRV